MQYSVKLLPSSFRSYGPSLPSNSPELNPLDYKVCSIMQQRVYETCRVDNIDDLKQTLVDRRLV